LTSSVPALGSTPNIFSRAPPHKPYTQKLLVRFQSGPPLWAVPLVRNSSRKRTSPIMAFALGRATIFDRSSSSFRGQLATRQRRSVTFFARPAVETLHANHLVRSQVNPPLWVERRWHGTHSYTVIFHCGFYTRARDNFSERPIEQATHANTPSKRRGFKSRRTLVYAFVV